MLFNRDKIILDLCGGTGSWSKPYSDAGYDVRIVTLPDNDVVDYIPPPNVHGVLAAPPCEEFSPALETRLMKNEGDKRNFKAGMHQVNACYRIIHTANPKFYCIENPSGHLKKWLGEPVFVFHPWNFGDPWTKKTSLWGIFNKPRFKYERWENVPKNSNLYIRPNREKPSIAFLHKSAQNDCFPSMEHECKTDAEFRAVTPPGFAQAFYRSNL